MPEERRSNVKREMSPVSDSDDSTSYHNVQLTKEKKQNGSLMKGSPDQLMVSGDLLERELFEARRMALERAQNDLVAAGFGQLAAMGLPFLPAHHALFGDFQQAEPLSLKMTRPSTNGTGGGAISSGGGMHNTNLPSGSSGGRTGGERDSPEDSIATSIEPEDLSLRASPKDEPSSPKDLIAGDRASSGLGTPNGEENGSTGAGSTSQNQNWSFEEQFKQLYELSDDSKRKEFLDDLFSYMQKRGTPVTRIPIMAKQVLDLYQLYKLVVAHGGLVEVINKKLWREITKGLNLPPSITSAAFTLRTQYMKFLYPFECEREKLSSPSELQAAIDGNRREGRRAGAAGGGYNPYSQISPTLLPRAHMNGGGAAGNGGGLGGAGSGLTPDEESMVGGLATPNTLANHPAFAAAYREHLAMEAHRQLERSQRSLEPGLVHHGKSGMDDMDNDSDDEDGSCSSPPAKKQATGRGGGGAAAASGASAAASDNAAAVAAAAITNSTAAAFASAQERLLGLGGLGIPSAHFKITGRGDGRSAVDSSLVVSMEINGVMYQGVLFAQPSSSRLAGTNGSQ